MEELRWYHKVVFYPLIFAIMVGMFAIMRYQRYRFKRNLVKVKGWSEESAEHEARISEEHDCFYGWLTGKEECYEDRNKK